MRYACTVFDLDGTILDTLDDLKNALNHALKLFGYAQLSREQVRAYIGNGVRNLVARALPAGTAEMVISSIVCAFKEHYNQNLNVETRPYPGMTDLFRDLKSAGVKVCINSNKYDGAVKTLCAAHYCGLYDLALGEMENVPRKPAPDGVNALLARVGTRPEDAIYIGDSGVDFQTARNAGLDFGWVSWGFRRADELEEAPGMRFDSVESLRGYLLG